MNINLKLIIPAAIVVLVAIFGVGYYFYSQSQKALIPSNLVAEVGKLIDLPEESPQIVTIADITKLQKNPFFQKAKNGDKVLIYQAAQKAILYDPNLKKILDVAPINVGSASASSTASAIPKPTPKPSAKK